MDIYHAYEHDHELAAMRQVRTSISSPHIVLLSALLDEKLLPNAVLARACSYLRRKYSSHTSIKLPGDLPYKECALESSIASFLLATQTIATE